ncbi:MAG: YidC/Oxa1 family membrane protein insertase [Armatimonadota bacterium]
MSKGTPTQSPRGSIVQMLLIAAVIFLGMQLFFPQRDKPQTVNPEELSGKWSEAVKEDNVAFILSEGQTYIKALEGEGEIAQAWEARITMAQARLQSGKKTGDYNQAVLAHNELRSLELEIIGTEADVPAAVKDATLAKTRAALKQTILEGDTLAKTRSNGFVAFGYSLVAWLTNLFGGARAPGFSYWFSAVVLAFLVRLIIWPLAARQYVAFKRMALLQPMMKELQGQYQGAELNQRMMKLYAKYGINPLAGCWPMLVQIPFFLWVFWSMRAFQFQYMNGTFFWVNPEMAAKYPGIIAPNLGERDVPLIIVYALSMVLSTQFTITSPENARQQKIIGFVLAALFPVMFIFWPLPSAFIVYWTALNIFSTAQTMIMARVPIPPLEEVPEERRKPNLFTPGDGPTGKNGASGDSKKTGAPVLHKKQGGKQKKRKRK